MLKCPRKICTFLHSILRSIQALQNKLDQLSVGSRPSYKIEKRMVPGFVYFEFVSGVGVFDLIGRFRKDSEKLLLTIQ